MYRFDFDNGKQFGAAHAAELNYVWNKGSMNSATEDISKRHLAFYMHNAWVSFIKMGNPNILLLPKWPEYKNNNQSIMTFDSLSLVIVLKEVFDDKDFPSAVFVMKGK